ncbi:MAG: hypothetical protein ABSB35_18210 [Bryobacteraceae bacterium]
MESTGLGAELETTVDKTTRKVEIEGRIVDQAAQMLGLERGLFIRVEMKDLAKAEEYHNQFGELSRQLTRAIAEVQPLLVTPQTKHNLEIIDSDLGAWLAAHRDFWRASQALISRLALDILIKRGLPPGNEIQALGNEVIQLQDAILAESLENGRSRASRNR